MNYDHVSNDELSNNDINRIDILLAQLEAEEAEGHKADFMPSYFTRPRTYSGNNLILATIKDDVVGLLDYHVYDNVCTINELVVDDNYRRNGIATMLYETLKKYLKENQWVNEIKLTVRSNNEATEFYQHIGFNPIKIEMCNKIT
jgi:ribosomal protein S18 acetylase RimI-like enzyme